MATYEHKTKGSGVEIILKAEINPEELTKEIETSDEARVHIQFERIRGNEKALNHFKWYERFSGKEWWATAYLNKNYTVERIQGFYPHRKKMGSPEIMYPIDLTTIIKRFVNSIFKDLQK